MYREFRRIHTRTQPQIIAALHITVSAGVIYRVCRRISCTQQQHYSRARSPVSLCLKNVDGICAILDRGRSLFPVHTFRQTERILRLRYLDRINAHDLQRQQLRLFNACFTILPIVPQHVGKPCGCLLRRKPAALVKRLLNFCKCILRFAIVIFIRIEKTRTKPVSGVKYSHQTAIIINIITASHTLFCCGKAVIEVVQFISKQQIQVHLRRLTEIRLGIIPNFRDRNDKNIALPSIIRGPCNANR